MALISRATLRDLVRKYADQETLSPNGTGALCTDDEINTYLAHSYGEYHDMLTDLFEDYFSTVATVAATLDSLSEYVLVLPSDFLKLRKIEYPTNSVWAPLTRVSLQESYQYNNTSAIVLSGGVQIRAYYLYGDNAKLLPPLSSSGSYRVWYAQRCPGFPASDTTGQIDDAQGWFEWIAIHSALKCKRKEGLDRSDLLQDLALASAKIKSAAATRNISSPSHILDTWWSDDEYSPTRRWP